VIFNFLLVNKKNAILKQPHKFRHSCSNDIFAKNQQASKIIFYNIFIYLCMIRLKPPYFIQTQSFLSFFKIKPLILRKAAENPGKIGKRTNVHKNKKSEK